VFNQYVLKRAVESETTFTSYMVGVHLTKSPSH